MYNWRTRSAGPRGSVNLGREGCRTEEEDWRLGDPPAEKTPGAARYELILPGRLNDPQLGRPATQLKGREPNKV